ncbi:MAG: hypothetical protein ACOY0T_01570 [Myxococcota bacterium]
MLRAPLAYLVSVVALFAVACGRNIGDDCKTSVDCSQGGERLCDITQPGGYCTIFNCEPNSCPSEAACVVFDPGLSARAECSATSGLSRFARSFCLLKCSSNDDCRDGYECQDFSEKHQPNAWNALAVDSDPERVCVVSRASHSVPAEPLPADNVCSGASTGGSSSMANGGSSGMGNGGTSNTGGLGAGGADAGAGGVGG